MEVDPTEVRAHSGPATKPVTISNISIEDRIHEVEPNPHASYSSPAVAQRRSVPQFVEHPRHAHNGKGKKQAAGRIQYGFDTFDDAMLLIQPTVEESRYQHKREE